MLIKLPKDAILYRLNLRLIGYSVNSNHLLTLNLEKLTLNLEKGVHQDTGQHN